jgi:hypothetical protein
MDTQVRDTPVMDLRGGLVLVTDIPWMDVPAKDVPAKDVPAKDVPVTHVPMAHMTDQDFTVPRLALHAARGNDIASGGRTHP